MSQKQKVVVKEKTAEIIKTFGKSAKNTGSVEAQIALITHRIGGLNEHFKSFPKDFQSRRGLLAQVSQRKRLLAYLRKNDSSRYTEVLRALNLRK